MGMGTHIQSLTDAEHDPETDANVRLIAAAPDLLAACEESRAALANIAKSLMDDRSALTVSTILGFIANVLAPAIAKTKGNG